MARKIADTKNMTHEEWLDLRKSSVGGSDSAALVGMNQYSSALTVYADKKGLSKPKETSEAMRLGTDLEAYVAERFAEKEGKKVRNDFFMYADDEYDFITANVDRRVVGENSGLECKTMGSFNGYNLEDGEIPSHYFCQVQHYCMVMGFDRMYLAILVLQRGLYVIPIERDDNFIKTLRDAEVHFWTHNILKNIPPAPDGSDAAFDTLKELYPESLPKTEIAIPGVDYLIKDYKAYSELEKEYKEKKNSIKAQICGKLGDNEVGVGNDYGCSWKSQADNHFDTNKFKVDYPDLYAKYVKKGTKRVFRVRHLSN